MSRRFLLIPLIALFISGCSCSFRFIDPGDEPSSKSSTSITSGTQSTSTSSEASTSTSDSSSSEVVPPKQTDFEYEIETYQEVEYAKITKVKFDTDIKELTIPNTLDDYPVGIATNGLLKEFTQLEKLKTSTISISFNTVNDFSYLFGGSSFVPTTFKSLEVDSPNIYRGSINNLSNLETLIFSNVTYSIYAAHLPALTKVTLNNVTALSTDFLMDTHSLEEIEVNGGEFTLDKGNLYSKDMTTLYRALSPIKDLSYMAPETLVKVQSYAFQNCSLVQSIYLGNNCTSLGTGVFKECTSLQNLTISRANSRLSYLFGTSVPSSLIEVSVKGGTTISSYFFANISTIPYLNLPNTITNVESYAFYNCTSLSTINLPNAISIGANAFKGCTASVYTFSNNSYSYGESAFENSSITSFTFPSSMKYVNKNLFKNCTQLTNITLPDEVIEIQEGAFEGCTKLGSITFPSSLTTIGKNAFKGCTSLTNLTFSANTKEIGESAFEGCNNLMSINLASSSASLGDKAFYGCSKLASISNTSNVTSLGQSCFANTTNAFTTAYYPKAQLKAFCFNGWSYLESLTLGNLPSGGTIPMLFSNTSFTNTYEVSYVESGTTYKYYVPNSLTNLTIVNESSIAKRYASNMTSLLTVNLNEGIKTIYSNAFSGCTNIDHLYLPNSITEIQSYAFTQLYNCRYIDSDPDYAINTSKRVITIAANAFSFKKLNWFVVPSGLHAAFADNAIYIPLDSSTTPIFYTACMPYGHSRTTEGDSWQKDKESWINPKGKYKVYVNYSSGSTTLSGYWHYVDGVPTLWH